MRKFKVIALSVSGKGKKIYSSGDEVLESGFPDGIVDDLVKGKYIKEVEESKAEKETKPKEETKLEKNEDDGKVQKTAGKKEVKK